MIAINSTGPGVVEETYSVLCKVDVNDNLYNIVVNTTIVKFRKGSVKSSGSSRDTSVWTVSICSEHHQIDISYQVSMLNISLSTLQVCYNYHYNYSNYII